MGSPCDRKIPAGCLAAGMAMACALQPGQSPGARDFSRGAGTRGRQGARGGGAAARRRAFRGRRRDGRVAASLASPPRIKGARAPSEQHSLPAAFEDLAAQAPATAAAADSSDIRTHSTAPVSRQAMALKVRRSV